MHREEAAGPTTLLARFVRDLQVDAVAESVRERARLALLNFLACAVAGATEAVVDRAARAALPYGGPERTTLIGRTERCDALTAAFLNCLASTTLAFDETHARSIVHPVGPVVAAALAIAEERHLGGAALLEAILVGVEACSRASLAISASPAQSHVGWSQSGLCGAIGAAAAVSKLLGLDEAATMAALALGLNAGSGLRAMNGTMSATVAVSNGAANGARAALMAQAGVAASAQALEHQYGFVALFARTGHLPHLTDGLGSAFAVSELNFKPYPCGIVAHAAIDAALVLAARPGFVADAVEDVIVYLSPSSIALGDRPSVSTDSEASVSVQFWVATALMGSAIGPDRLRPDWIDDPARRRLHARIGLRPDPDCGLATARIEVRLGTGESLRAEVRHALGSDGRPMTATDIERKLASAASGHYSRRRVDEIADRCRTIERVADVADFMALLGAQE